MILDDYLYRIKELPSYIPVAEYSLQQTTESEHFFNCCLLVCEICTSVGDIDEVWDSLGRQELCHLDLFMDPKKISEANRIGQMLYRYEDDLDKLRGRFHKSALIRLSEKGLQTQDCIIALELSGPDHPSKRSMKRFEALCDDIDRDMGSSHSKKKSVKAKNPYEAISSDLKSRFKIVELNLKAIRESILRVDFKESIDQDQLASLHELIGAFDVEIMKVKDELRRHFKEAIYDRKRK